VSCRLPSVRARLVRALLVRVRAPLLRGGVLRGGFLRGGIVCLGLSVLAAGTVDGQSARLRVETVVGGLDTPWDLAWGPDDAIWITERGGRVSRLDPGTGNLSFLGEIPDVHETGEAGLMGMAFHPDFDAEPWIYLAHSYGEGRSVSNRLIRVRWENGRLGRPDVLVDGIPGQWNHDGSRLVFGPDGFLYMTMGDAGNRAAAHDRSSPSGKVLRLTPGGSPAPGNPFGNAVYSYGHRNPQGIVFHPESGALYLSEHGPRTDDEVMRVEEGADHGWPEVHGFCDGDPAGEDRYCARNRVVEPLVAWTPTVGISGLDYYGHTRIPGWEHSLLATSLTGESLFRLELSASGGEVVERERLFRGEYGRLRDVLVAPDGAVYLAVSNRDGRGSPVSDDDRILRVVPRR